MNTPSEEADKLDRTSHDYVRDGEIADLDVAKSRREVKMNFNGDTQPDTPTPESEQELRLKIAKALHGKPDPSVLFEYKTYERFWEHMAAAPAVDRLMQLITARDSRTAKEARIDEIARIPVRFDGGTGDYKAQRLATLEKEGDV